MTPICSGGGPGAGGLPPSAGGTPHREPGSEEPTHGSGNTEQPPSFEEICQEFIDLLGKGESPTIDSYAERYPDYAENIREVFPTVLAIERLGRSELSSTLGGEQNLLGERLGEFLVVREIGRGGMGVVYEAVQSSIGRCVALKVLPPGVITPTRLERFIREAQSAGKLHHPHIVPVFSVGEDRGLHYFAMQLIAGRSLQQALLDTRQAAAHQDRGQQTWLESVQRYFPENASLAAPHATIDIHSRYHRFVARLGREVAEALQSAHAQGILHRDIKPSNILIDDQSSAWVVDFGLAKEEGVPELTPTGDLVGTLSYLAPERIRGRSSERGDIYSLGVTLYQLLSPRPPFESGGRNRLITPQSEADPLRLRQHDPNIPKELESIVMMAMARDPRDRYQTAQALADDLDRFLKGMPISSRPPAMLERAWRRCRRRPVLLGITCAFSAALLLCAVFFVKYRSSEEVKARLESDAPGARSLWLAKQLYVSGQYQGSLEELERLLRSEPSRIEAWILRSKILMEAGQIDKAIENLQALILRQPELSDAHILLAQAYRGRNENKAAFHGKQAEQLSSQDPDSLLRSTTAMSWEGSREVLDLFIRRYPSDPRALLARGTARYALNDPPGAEADLQRALEISPQDFKAHAMLALVLESQGRPKEALGHLDLAITAAPDELTLHSQRRGCLHRSGDHLGELSEAKRCVDLRPDLLIQHLELLGALHCIGDFARAHEAFVHIVRSDPSHRPTVVSWLRKRAFLDLHRGASLFLPPTSMANSEVIEIAKAVSYFRHVASGSTVVVEQGFRSSWSPDSRFLVHTRAGRENGELLNEKKKAQAEHRLWNIEVLDLQTGRRNLLAVGAKDPVWSPDGRHIAFIRNSAYYNEEIWVVPAAGGPERRLTPGGHPSWSRDSNHVYYHSRTDRALYRIAIEPGGEPAERLVPSPGWYPTVSPDEKLVAYAVRNELRIADLRTGRLVLGWVVPREEQGLLVEWSPDSLQLGVGGFNNSRLGLWILDLVEGTVRKLIGGPATMGSWSPDGSMFSFDIRGPITEIWLSRTSGNGSLFNGLSSSPTFTCLPPPLSEPIDRAETARRDAEARLLTLESACVFSEATPVVEARLRELRSFLEPDLPSFSSIDAAFGSVERGYVVPPGAAWRFFRGVREPSPELEWTQPGFDDGQWEVGRSSFGYGSAYFTTQLDSMEGSYSAVYLRHVFAKPDLADSRINLVLKVCGGAVAYLNGKEIGRLNAGSADQRIPFDDVAADLLDPTVEHVIPIGPAVLRQTGNVLALQGLSVATNSSQFALEPVLRKAHPETGDSAVRARLSPFFKFAESRTDRAAQTAYAEGRLLSITGGHLEAAEKFQQALRRKPALEPLLRLAESLRAAGKPNDAEDRLRESLQAEHLSSIFARRAWELWIELSLADLHRTPAEALARCPRGTGAPSSIAASYIGFLRQLAADGSVRINCGGEAFESASGKTWIPDVFYTSGFPLSDPRVRTWGPCLIGIEATEDDLLFQTQREFSQDGQPVFQGYRIPLPSGSYRVTLHFAEVLNSSTGQRNFDVKLDGKLVLGGYDPIVAGFATARGETAEVSVVAGILAIEVVPRVGSPTIAAIEVVKRS